MKFQEVHNMGITYHVAKNGSDKNNGTKENPFFTIQKAADIAVAGDTVLVHEGEYREWVRPRNSGAHENCRIVYQAAEGEHVVIKGSEKVENWEPVEGTVWKTEIANDLFGTENPFTLEIMGDWLKEPYDNPVHRGDVYLNGRSLYEAQSLEEVKNPKARYASPYDTWENREEKILNPEYTIYQWYAEVNDETTVIYANFQGANPNKELTEINVRSYCFYPEVTGLNYITVRGFEMAQAATPWTPPTAVQPGLLGCNWSKGWIIENNHIHDSKCSGISIGKEVTTGNNDFTKWFIKAGYHNQMEAVFKAKKIGWSKENIGSHIIRNNIIHDCGQNGIVGHLGCIFSEIYGNEIYNIAKKYEFFGHEIAGIKLHTPIDVQIRNNYIHHCSLGLWLDWQAQGARISSNVFDCNDRDGLVEVTHGPHLIDNNIFTSGVSMINAAQGGAFVHNLFCGLINQYPVLDRSTPYHFWHSTDIMGTTLVYGLDDRWYQNIFLDKKEKGTAYGTDYYNGAPTSLEEYIDRVRSHGHDDIEMYQREKQPVYINANVYYNNAPHFDREESYYSTDAELQARILDDGNDVYLELNVDPEMFSVPTQMISTETLGVPRIVGQRFENPDGTDIVFDKDLNGCNRTNNPTAGPLENLVPGYNKIKVWTRKNLM